MSSTLLPVFSRLPLPTSVPALLTVPALIRELHYHRCRTEEPGYATGNPPEDYGQTGGGFSFPWMIVVL